MTEMDAEWLDLPSNWQAQGLSARRIADMLAEVGAIDEIDDATLADATKDEVTLFGLMGAGGGRQVWTDLDTSESPAPNDELFMDLVHLTRPRVGIEDVSQTDDGEECTVEVVHAGAEHRFTVPSGDWLDDAGVERGFNQFMIEIGHDDRCFRLATGDGNGVFLLARTEFRAVAERLAIPLESDA